MNQKLLKKKEDIVVSEGRIFRILGAQTSQFRKGAPVRARWTAWPARAWSSTMVKEFKGYVNNFYLF
jgi:hypothetical protein